MSVEASHSVRELLVPSRIKMVRVWRIIRSQAEGGEGEVESEVGQELGDVLEPG